MNILFVCSGNISRSFLAEMLLKHEIEEQGVDGINVSSAGLYAYEGNRPDEEMVAYLFRTGISSPEHAARQLTKEAVDWADLILVMEKAHADAIRAAWPESVGKLKHLGEFISEGMDLVDDIVDPFGRSPYHYRLAQSQITLAVKALLKKLVSDRRGKQDAQTPLHSG